MKITNIDTAKIIEPANQVRKVMSAEALEDLTASIKQVGLIMPLAVISVGDKFEVKAGHRRLLACRMAGIPQIPCVVRDPLEVDNEEIKIHENLFREDVNAVDEAEFYTYMIDKKKMSIEELARMIRKSGTYVRDRLNLLHGDPLIVESVRDGMINPSIARELNLITEDATREYYLQFAIDNGAKLRTVQEWRRQWERQARTREALAEGYKTEDLPEVLPKYYFRCPMCQKGVDMQHIRSISVCEPCQGVIQKLIAAPAEEEAKQ